jgi:DNA-binding PadR family transcriptional regulator
MIYLVADIYESNYEGRIVISKRHISNPLALAVLALLDERPMHPYEMGVLLRERGKQESIKLNYGSLYTVIEALQRNQLITPQETLREGRRPERTVYALTEAGRAELFDWLRALLREPAKEYTQFAAGLSFVALLPPSEVVALLEDRAVYVAQEIESMRDRMDAALHEGLARLFLIEIEHEVVLREAELRWVREIRDAIANGTLSGMQEWLAFHAEHTAGKEDDETTNEQ